MTQARRLFAAPPPPPSEERAAALLGALRGRPPIQNLPKAARWTTKIVSPLIARKSVSAEELARLWPEIVGESLARVTAPARLAGGVLTLRAPSAAAPFVQHQAPLILERCRLAGARAETVKIEQGALRPAARRPAAAPAPSAARAISAAQEKSIAELAAKVEDEGLRAVLTRLGRAVAARD